MVVFDAYKTHIFNFFHIQNAYKMTKNAYRTHTGKKKASHFFGLKKVDLEGHKACYKGHETCHKSVLNVHKTGYKAKKGIP
ncbi:hypothetical protein COM88_01000 [Bacillus cereus]|nr:hypothetical protein COM88_01000 [Bacillus cereus]PGQ75383.1 hypothetical protein COA26_17985 [Bacillus cereus]